ncbi:MAG: N-acetylmuramoyl-L-alanine amidase [Candidatus Omnitrophota bacterium]
MIKQNNAFFIIILLGISIAFSGCASTRGVKKGHRLDKGHYVSLKSICSEHGLSWQWDGFSKVIIVKKLQDEIRLYPGASLILYNRQIRDMQMPVYLREGIIMVPVVFADLFVKEKDKLPSPQGQRKEVTIRKIVIDAGHGGKDPGASGQSIVPEKNIVLDIASRLKKELQAGGIKVIMTRDTDIFIPLKERSEIANSEKADFFISIHANAADASGPKGFEAFYLSNEYDDFSKAVQIKENAVVAFEQDADYEYSADLNTTIWDMIFTENRIESIEMAYAISGQMNRMLKLKTRYIRGAKFLVLKDAQMPSILLEVGYLSNSTESAQLNNAYYRQMLAEAIAAGVMQYKKSFEMTEGFSR